METIELADFAAYFIDKNNTNQEPITPTIKLRINTRSWMKNPYSVRINVPSAKITNVTKERFSEDLVLYNLYA